MINDDNDPTNNSVQYQGFLVTTVAGVDISTKYKEYDGRFVSNAQGFDPSPPHDVQESSSHVEPSDVWNSSVIVYHYDTSSFELLGEREFVTAFQQNPSMFNHAVVSGVYVETTRPLIDDDSEKGSQVGFGLLDKLRRIGAWIAPVVLILVGVDLIPDPKHPMTFLDYPEFQAVHERYELDPHVEISSANGTSGLSRET